MQTHNGQTISPYSENKNKTNLSMANRTYLLNAMYTGKNVEMLEFSCRGKILFHTLHYVCCYILSQIQMSVTYTKPDISRVS